MFPGVIYSLINALLAKWFSILKRKLRRKET